MQFNFSIPTKVYFGANCIADNANQFSQWGSKALIVTGRNSAKISGAFDDVVNALSKAGIDWELFDQIEENPTFEAVKRGGEQARRYQPQMIIAIGGGSPLDAGKAIAALATNNIAVSALYNNDLAIPPLPLIAIPLSAGTGSEITPYSILTDSERQTKRSFSNPLLFPQAAFLDARYTQTLSENVTIHSAVDALSHSVEGYLAKRATPVTDSLALAAITCFGKVRAALTARKLTFSDRELLLYISLLGGMVIAHTGTSSVHGLGYPLTYYHRVPHGRANGLLLAEYLRFNQPVVPDKITSILQALNLTDLSAFQAWMSGLLDNSEVYTAKEVAAFAASASTLPNATNMPRQATAADLEQWLRHSLTVE